MQTHNLSHQENLAIEKLLDAFFDSRPTWQLIQYSQGIVIEGHTSTLEFILKAFSGQVDRERLRLRLDWVSYLHEHQSSDQPRFAVPNLIPSLEGCFIETAAVEDSIYSAYAYVKFPLMPVNKIDWSDNSLPEQLGAVIAKMHSLAGTYRRQRSLEGFDHILTAPWLSPSETRHFSQQVLLAPIEHLRQSLAGFPQSEDIFGLVHDDLHTGNVFHLNGRLVILDFDCTVRHWFAADLASALLFRIWIGPERESLRPQAELFLRGLLCGYQKLRPLPAGWAKMLPVFLKLRELSLYWSFFWDDPHLDPAQSEPGCFPRYVHDSLLTEKPFLEIDFSKLE